MLPGEKQALHRLVVRMRQDSAIIIMHCVCVLLLCMHIAHKYDNFTVGLTNVSPNVSTPTLYNYTLCGQYPGAAPNGATVSLYCRDNLPPFRYVIVQIPLTVLFVACEVEVIVRGMKKLNFSILAVIFNNNSNNNNNRFICTVPLGPNFRGAGGGNVSVS